MLEIDRNGNYVSSTENSFPSDIEYEFEKIDHVNHPSHYNRDGAMECIDELELIFGPEMVMYFCLGNVFKYRYRAGDKNGQEDLEKSDWYMKKYKEYKEKANKEKEANQITVPYSPWTITPQVTYTSNGESCHDQ